MSDDFSRVRPFAPGHRIRRLVYLDPGTLVPRESSMRGSWPSEAKCSCGWQTRSGGAVESFIDREVDDHKLDVRLALRSAS